jgi:CxxC motif-containing protein (DUF1111 family)
MRISSPSRRFAAIPLPVLLAAITAFGCETDEAVEEPAIAEGIFAPLGEVLPSASAEQRATFERGKAVAMRRFKPSEGLGPTFNVTFCGSCHERPVLGGSAPRYRDFFLQTTQLPDGSFVDLPRGGVVRSQGIGEAPLRPGVDPSANVFAHRNPIPFFGTGLIAEIDEAAILANVDPDDADGDGVSGRANYDRGFVGRFGRKAQTVSIEGFVRGPLNNHIGLTSDPLTDEQKARLPVPSVASDAEADEPVFRQAAAPDQPLTDDDAIPDPELAPEDLFDVVAFSMLLAAPEPSPPSPESEAGRARFDEIGCATCHVPALEGPRGLIPLYSDLLIHDMGEALADGLAMRLASGSEFRTQPLWGVVATGPWLHDGRASTLDEAIRLHGGEAARSAAAYIALDDEGRAEVLAFLASLGGAELASPGLLPPGAPVPEPGTPGAPLPTMDLATWLAGRAIYDRDFTPGEGLGPTFNGDSCRACHFDPVVGGAGPSGLDVIHRGGLDASGDFVTPSEGTVIHRLATFDRDRAEPGADDVVFERRQTPTNLGLGRIEAVDEAAILAAEDPMDLDGDGVRGIAQRLPDGRLGRFGWKAQIPSVREFVRDALSVELGATVPPEPGLTFGTLADADGVADPEADFGRIDALEAFLTGTAPPPFRGDEATWDAGLAAFAAAACDACHTPTLPALDGDDVPLFSDLLTHQLTDDVPLGIVLGVAGPGAFRTPPLWGVGQTQPYMHDGRAETLAAAIAAHGGEAQAARAAYEALPAEQRDALLTFLAAL